MSRHLKAYAAPKSWTILRKVNKWIMKPLPGAHPLARAIPVGLLLKQKGFARISKELKKIMAAKAVIIDGKVVKNFKTGIGLMDVVSIAPSTTLRATIDAKGRLQMKEISDAEVKKKVCKIVGKQTIKGAKVQISLFDGRTLLLEKNQYAVGDSLVIEVPSQKVLDHFTLDKGNTVFLLGGRHTAKIAKVQEVNGDKVKCKSGNEEFETLKKFVFIVGKEKPVVTL